MAREQCIATLPMGDETIQCDLSPHREDVEHEAIRDGFRVRWHQATGWDWVPRSWGMDPAEEEAHRRHDDRFIGRAA